MCAGDARKIKKSRISLQRLSFSVLSERALFNWSVATRENICDWGAAPAFRECRRAVESAPFNLWEYLGTGILCTCALCTLARAHTRFENRAVAAPQMV
jgi:hypothetical protein